MPKTNKEYIRIAKDAMRGSWPRTLLFTFLGCILIALIYVAPVMLSISYVINLKEPIFSFGRAYQLYLLKILGALVIAILIYWLLMLLAMLGQTKICLRPFRNEKAHFADLFVGFRRPLRTLGNALLATLRCAAFCLLWSIPGLCLYSLITMMGFALAANIFFIIYVLVWMFACASYSLYYSDVQLIQLLHPDFSIRQLHRRNRAVMKGHRWQYVRLFLRQWPYFLLYFAVCLPPSILSELYTEKIFLSFLLSVLTELLFIPLMVWMNALNNAFILDLDAQLDPPAEQPEDLPEEIAPEEAADIPAVPEIE